MEGLKGRVGFVAIGAYGGNQTSITFPAAKDAVRTAINQKQSSVKTWTTW